MKIRVDRPVGGLFPECQPEIGKVYTARPGAPLGGATRKGFVVIDLKQKKNIILREGEFEIVEEDTEKKVRGQWDKERAFAMLDSGMTVKEVAAELGVTVKQVEGAKYTRKKKQEEAMRKLLEEEHAPQEERAPQEEETTNCPSAEECRGYAAAPDPESLMEALCREREKNYRMERALLALVLEKYA